MQHVLIKFDIAIQLETASYDKLLTSLFSILVLYRCLDALRHPFLCGPRWRVVPSIDIIRWGLGSTAVRITEEYIYGQTQVSFYTNSYSFSCNNSVAS